MSAAGFGTDCGAGTGGSGAFVWPAAVEQIRARADRIAVCFIGSRDLVFVARALALPNSLGTAQLRRAYHVQKRKWATRKSSVSLNS